MPRCSAFLVCLSYRLCPIRPCGAPSPRGEGAPQGRIGHRRYERQTRKAEQRGICGGEARDPDRERQRLNQCFLKKSLAPLPLEGADERSEAGLASLNVGVPFHAANLRPFGAPPSKGRREKKGAACIVIGIYAAKPTPSLLYPLPLKPAPTISSSKGV